MTKYADTVYDHNAPGQQSAGYPYVKSGYDSNEERLTSQALAMATNVPREALQATTNPPASKLFPPRFGYAQTELSIRDVIQVDRRYPDSSAQFSGTSGGYAGSSTPSLGWW